MRPVSGAAPARRRCRTWCRFLVGLSLACGWTGLATPAPAQETDRLAALVAFERTTAGVIYEFGECSARRMDCSCFVQLLFAKHFDFELPRTTLSQVLALDRHRVSWLNGAAQLTEETLCVGDLIFTYQGRSWRGGHRHVAVYAGGGRVLHAASWLGGVGFSDLSWVRGYSLHGVYRPLGCAAKSHSHSPPSPTTHAERGPSEASVLAVIDQLFRAWETLDLQLYLAGWSPEAEQSVHGRSWTLTELAERQRQLFAQLDAVRARHHARSVFVWGDIAIAEVSYTFEFRFRGALPVERRQREAFLMRRIGGIWLITRSSVSADG